MNVTFRNLEKTFYTLRGKVEALKSINLKIGPGEFFILLGPSGCGKSTTLNLTAGLERPTGGEIRFADRIVSSPEKKIFVSPKERNVAMVFQSYALYPHLSVFENIAFPLRVAKQGEIGEPVQKTAHLLDIEDLLDRKPAELSGGQRQRVAIARALVRNPDLFLLDEPLSNLDAQLRTSMRAELKRLQRDRGITTIYVTHDQTEAMTLGDRIGLFRDGDLIQLGTPDDLYNRPQTPFVATFVGSPPMNLIGAEIRKEGDTTVITYGEGRSELPKDRAWLLERLAGREALLGIRPEHVTLSTTGESSSLQGRVETVETLGRELLYHVHTGVGTVVVLSTEEELQVGDTVHPLFDPSHLHLFPKEHDLVSER
jgi:multiple sugar transport system ATP-binding protein